MIPWHSPTNRNCFRLLNQLETFHQERNRHRRSLRMWTWDPRCLTLLQNYLMVATTCRTITLKQVGVLFFFIISKYFWLKTSLFSPCLDLTASETSQLFVFQYCKTIYQTHLGSPLSLNLFLGDKQTSDAHKNSELTFNIRLFTGEKRQNIVFRQWNQYLFVLRDICIQLRSSGGWNIAECTRDLGNESWNRNDSSFEN